MQIQFIQSFLWASIAVGLTAEPMTACNKLALVSSGGLSTRQKLPWDADAVVEFRKLVQKGLSSSEVEKTLGRDFGWWAETCGLQEPPNPATVPPCHHVVDRPRPPFSGSPSCGSRLCQTVRCFAAKRSQRTNEPAKPVEEKWGFLAPSGQRLGRVSGAFLFSWVKHLFVFVDVLHPTFHRPVDSFVHPRERMNVLTLGWANTIIAAGYSMVIHQYFKFMRGACWHIFCDLYTGGCGSHRWLSLWVLQFMARPEIVKSVVRL